MRKFWIVFVILAVLVIGGLGLLWNAVMSLDDSGPIKGSVLHWKAAGSYPESPPDGFLEQLQIGDVLTHQQLLSGLDRAAGDPSIEALILDLRGVSLNWAQLEELHGAVIRFRETGKTVWAYLQQGSSADFALATAANRVVMAPESNLMVLGVVAELAFLRDTLGKLGLEADFVHVGQFKSAPEQLTRTAPSDANRQMTVSLVEARYRLLVDLIARGRERNADTVRDWIDVGLYDGQTALAAGLIDTLLDASTLLGTVYPEDELVDLDRYALRSDRIKSPRQIALVVATGTIVPGKSRHDNLQGRLLGSDTIIEQLAQARRDRKIGAVVLRVHSPGGSALASDLIWREIARVREVKPVIVSMGGYAASGGYYIACGADSIFADEGTLTGSIGVFAGKLDWSGLYDKLGVHREFVTRGENALFWRDAGGFTPAQRALLQSHLDRFYDRFIDKVAEGRNLTRGAAEEAARGRVWTGGQALELGLVDGLGGLNRALAAARTMMGISPQERVQLKLYSKQLNWLERNLLGILQTHGGASGLSMIDRSRRYGRFWFHDLPQPLADLAARLAGSGFADTLPLLDGQPLALMPWRDVPRQGSVSCP